MGSVVIVVVEPVFADLVSGLIVSFYFAVLLGMIRFDHDMTDAVLGEQGGE